MKKASIHDSDENSVPGPPSKKISNRRKAKKESPDFYPTPEWATRALLHYEEFSGEIWECACGDGAISEALKANGNEVTSSDLFDRGYGTPDIDFLGNNEPVENIITNPPFNIANKFVVHGDSLYTNKMAFLLRLAFLEGSRRHKCIFSKIAPSRVWVFSERLTLYPKGATVTSGGTTAFAWFVWDRSHEGKTEVDWIQPGFREKYSK